jgi:type IV pilus assembly protein PilN
VILINLLPHREATRKRRRDAFNAAMVGAVIVGLLIACGVYLWYQARISEQGARNQYLQAEIAKLDVQIKDISNIEGEIAALRERQKAVEDLQSDRNLQVHLLNELVRQLPDGVYLTDMRQVDQTVTIKGTAQSNERVSELLRNLGNNSPWLSRPQLVEIVTGTVALTPRDIRRVANFKISVHLLRSSEILAAAAASAGSSSGPGAGPAPRSAKLPAPARP